MGRRGCIEPYLAGNPSPWKRLEQQALWGVNEGGADCRVQVDVRSLWRKRGCGAARVREGEEAGAGSIGCVKASRTDSEVWGLAVCGQHGGAGIEDPPRHPSLSRVPW